MQVCTLAWRFGQVKRGLKSGYLSLVISLLKCVEERHWCGVPQISMQE
jgi:hypothetical protein